MDAQILVLLVAAALIAQYGAQVALSKLNRESARQPVPAALRKIFSDAVLAKMRCYVDVNSWFARLEGAVSLVLLLIFWALGGWRYCHELAVAAGGGEIVTGVLFFGVCGLLSWVSGQPFDWVRTFQIEEAFGFNRTTVGTYVADQVKGLALGAVLGGLLSALVLWLLLRLGDWAWLAAFGAVAAWVLALQAVAPAWLLPLFLKFTELPDGSLRQAVVDYAARVKFPAAGIYEIDGSRRSAKANAVIAGWGPWRRIALFDTLTEKMTDDQSVAVVAHEVGHWHHRHLRKRIIGSLFQMFVFFAALGWVLQEPMVYQAMGIPAGGPEVAIVFFMIALGPLGDLLAPFSHAVERKHEFEADAYAAKTADGAALIAALETLGCDSLSNPTPHPWCVRAWYSHPPLAERISAIERCSS